MWDYVISDCWSVGWFCIYKGFSLILDSGIMGLGAETPFKVGSDCVTSAYVWDYVISDCSSVGWFCKYKGFILILDSEIMGLGAETPFKVGLHCVTSAYVWSLKSTEGSYI